jgi:hypothetical protein|tara:strand:- start:23491 stop:23652 length:162 start_codon:yes stop_codon:yes gene_type:complete
LIIASCTQEIEIRDSESANVDIDDAYIRTTRIEIEEQPENGQIINNSTVTVEK